MKRLLVPAWLKIVKPCNRFIITHWGRQFPMYTVSEYPKSGGTWLGRMIADCLEVPLPQRFRLPLAMPCVVHNHWTYDRRFTHPFYLYRDGRDIMVSFYFHRMRVIARNKDVNDRLAGKRYERLFGKGYDPQDVRRWLPRFIEHEFAHPRDSRVTWARHVESWYDPDRTHVAYLSYEDLLADTRATLTRAVEHVAGRRIEPWRIDMAVEKFSMARQTGRAPGEEDRSSFIRKGISGDWKNHFTREAAEIFHDRAGATLIALGYETDQRWIDRPDPVAEKSGPG